jgi:hypothetical protein
VIDNLVSIASQRRKNRMSQEKKELQIYFPNELKGGVYCNSMMVTHTREEFIMDFMMIAPPVGSVTARVIMSPGHMKRVLSAIQTNLKTYENKFGTIQEAAEPGKGKFGFQP